MTERSSWVLIVEEPEGGPSRLEAILADAGFDTSTAEVDVVVTTIEQRRPDVVVLDLHLHRGESARLLAELSRIADDGVPMILTGEGSNLLKPVPVIPFGLVPRPVDPEHLVSMVRRALRGRALTAV